MQYFAQDEATRLDPALTVHETLSSGSPHHMVPAIRNILGGFLFSGDDVYKKAGVLSGGERTRLAVARMLLRPSNTLLLDEPTNHLDIDSKEVLLDALADYGGTLIFVSHDRYFVEKLATKIIEVGDGKATLYPGTYEASCGARANGSASPAGRQAPRLPPVPRLSGCQARSQAAEAQAQARSSRRQARAVATRIANATRPRRKSASAPSRRSRIASPSSRRASPIARRPSRTSSRRWRRRTSIRDHEKSKPVLAQHQALMWEVGELLGQWEMLQSEAEQYADLRNS